MIQTRKQVWIFHPPGWLVLLTLVIFLVFMILVLPAQSQKSAQESNNAPSPDMSFFYTTDDLYQMAESYGEAGRTAYIRTRFRFDVVWPLVYGVFLFTSTGWLGKRVFSSVSRWNNLSLVPILAVGLDYLENLSTSLVMARFPAKTVLIDGLAPVFTMLKWGFVSASFIIPIVLLFILLVKKVSRKGGGF